MGQSVVAYVEPPTTSRNGADKSLDGLIRIPESHLAELNRTTSEGGHHTLIKAPDRNGGTEYFAMIDGFHQIHCLNLIRQYTWRDYYFNHQHIVDTPADLLDSDVGARMHVDHCIEALRLTLMCHGDTTPLFAYKDERAPGGLRADFSAHHRCTNWDRLADWMSKNEESHPTRQEWVPEHVDT